MNLYRNLLLNYLLSIFSLVIPIVVFPYLTRTLSIEKFGTYLWIDSITQYFLVFTTYGIPYYAVREISKYKDDIFKVKNITLQMVFIQFAFTVIICLLFFLLMIYLPILNQNSTYVFLGIIYMFFSCFIIEWFFQGLGKYAYITTRTSIIKVFSTILIFCFVKKSEDTIIYASIVVVTLFLNAIFNIFYFFKETREISSDLIDNITGHLKPLSLFFLINVSISIYTLLDSTLLGLFDNPANLSYYSMPLKLVKIYWSILNSASLVFMPEIVKYVASNDYKSVTTLLSKSVNIILLGSIPFVLLCNLFPEFILSLAFGPVYEKSSLVLRILSFLPLIIGLCNVFTTQFLMATGKENIILKATIGGLIISIFTNVCLIPYFSIVGCGIATVASELFVLIYALLNSVKFFQLKLDLALLKSLLFSSLISICIFCLLNYQFYNSIALFALVMIAYIVSFAILSIIVFKSFFILQLKKLITSYVRRYLSHFIQS